MNSPIRLLPLLLLSSLIPHPSSFLRADGGTVQCAQEVGPYRVTVFTAPTPLRAGPVDISVLIQDVATAAPLPDSRVVLHLMPPGEATGSRSYEATREAATNKLFRAVNVELPTPGRWQVEAQVEGEQGPARVCFDLDAAEPAPRWLALWYWLAWPLVPIVLFVLQEVLPSRGGRRLGGVGEGCS